MKDDSLLMKVSSRTYIVLLWALVVLLICAIAACAAEPGGHRVSADSARPDSARPGDGRPMRLLLASSEARDSIDVVQEFYVDQALRRAFDSIPAARFLTLNYRDSLADLVKKEEGHSITVQEIGSRLNLDGVIFTRFARFNSVLALELRLVDPRDGRLLYRDLNFSMIRYRDSANTMLIGPALYDVLRKSVGRYFKVGHTEAEPIATEPLIVGSVRIPRDSSLGLISARRQGLSTLGVKAIGEYARLNLPELVAFDYVSRNRVYNLVGVEAVDDYEEMTDLEKRALFSVGIDRYITAVVTPISADSLRMRMEIRQVLSPSVDSLIDDSEATVSVKDMQTTQIERDFTVKLIDVAEPLLTREAERVRAAYRNGGDRSVK